MTLDSKKTKNFVKFSIVHIVAYSSVLMITGLVINLFSKIMKLFSPGTLSFNYDKIVLSDIRMMVALLILGSIVYFIFTFKINSYLKNKELKKDSALRTNLTHALLFICFLGILNYLYWLLMSLLQLEFKFLELLENLFKVFIWYLVFSFYYYDIKRTKIKKKDDVLYMFFVLGLCIVIVMIMASVLLLIKLPKDSKNWELDENNNDKINSIVYEIDNYYANNKSLPKNLDILENIPKKILIDSNSNKKYKYLITGKNKYQICTSYKNDSNHFSNYKPKVGGQRMWYISGQNCLDFEIIEGFSKLKDD